MQPLLSLFCEVQNLDTEGFQLAGSLLQHSDLMRDRDVGEVRIDDLYNLVVVISQLLKLEIKVIQTGNKLHFRRVASDDNELLPEDSFDDKPAAVMLRSGFAEQFVEVDVLLFIEVERVFIAQRSGLLSGLVCQFSVGIHNIGSKGVRLGRTPGLAERAPFVCRKNFRHTKVQLARLK